MQLKRDTIRGKYKLSKTMDQTLLLDVWYR